MRYEDLKKYVILSDGNQINQEFTHIEKSDTVEKDGKLYVFYKEVVLDGKAYPYKGLAQVVYTCQTERCMVKHLKAFREGSSIYLDAIKQCIAGINASSEYHIKKETDLLKDPKKEAGSTLIAYYKGMHHAMEALKQQMSHQIVWSNNELHYFGDGTLRKPEWYDSPFGMHIENSWYW